MIQFASYLKKEFDIKIEQIECSEMSMITKSLDASRILVKAFNQLKAFILSYNFKDEEHENTFATEIEYSLGSDDISLKGEEIMKQVEKIPFTLS